MHIEGTLMLFYMLISCAWMAGECPLEEVFCQNFTAGVPGIGEVVTVELCEGGADVAVTEDNRREFVDAYVDYFLVTSVHRQV